MSLLAAGLSLCGTAQAAFESRLAGQAYYDSALDITWLADANTGAGSIFDDGSNTADGRMRWSSALDWAASLTVGGSTAWRLPSMDRNGDSTIIDCAGASAAACADNEYGYHFYVSGIDSTNSAPFSNVGTDNYWSATADGSNAWLFDFTFNDGSQLATSQNFNALAWAVHDGDIALVPLPAAAWLLGSGLMGLLLGLRRHTAG
ncbi:MAG: DUF1566 domain-containing protein [Gammaproteobacteria bacterium]